MGKEKITIYYDISKEEPLEITASQIIENYNLAPIRLACNMTARDIIETKRRNGDSDREFMYCLEILM